MMRHRLDVVVAVAVAAMVVAAAAGYARGGNAGAPVISACVAHHGGGLYLAKHCQHGDHRLTWPGSQASPGPVGVAVGAVFGDGSGGSRTITTSQTLLHDTYYRNLTVAGGGNLDTGGYRLFVSGTLTLENGARISRNAAANAGLVAGTLGGSGSGGIGTSPGSSVADALGGDGGAAVTPGGVATPPAANLGGPDAMRSALAAVSGVVIVAARTVVVHGSATISADGASSPGGGGGGGGGVVIVIATSPQRPALVLNAKGGKELGPTGHDGNAGYTAWLH